jgi:ABC-2 type transport system permease protein
VTTNAIATIAYRDLIKFLRDPPRLVATLVFPVVFVGVVGPAFQGNLGEEAGFDFVTFIYTGVFAQTLFQSAALGIVSLIEDRQTDFSQELFIAPISRYAIVFGKILGESLVALTQGAALIAVGMLIAGVRPAEALGLLVTALPICLFGGAFGLLLLGNMGSQRAAQQLFPFIFLPQFFLAGVFNPIKVLPWYLEIPSYLSPLRYAVDVARGVFYAGDADRDEVVLQPVAFNAALMAGLFVVFLVLGTALFVRAERNR